MKFSKLEIQELLIKFYPSLKDEEVEILLSICTYEIFESREIILERGRNDKKFFIILKGSARSYSVVNDIELNCHLRSEGFLMGDARSFSDTPISLLDTEAITDVHALIFDMGDLEKIGFENPQMMMFYLSLMKEIIAVFSHRIHTFVTMNASERYCDLMEWNPLYLKSTYDKHLASFLGVTPLTFHRVKNRTIK